MPRSPASKGFNTFVQGIVTESSALNFPENASIDEENFVLNRDGSRQRRLGIDFEDNYTLTGGFVTDNIETDAISISPWYNAGNDGSNNFAVVQVGSDLHFYDIEQASISSNKKSFTVSLLTFAKPSTANLSLVTVECTSGRGFLFVVSSEINPFFIEYFPETDTIVTTLVTMRIRDVLGVDDGLAVDERPATLSDLHSYNLTNQGWLTTSAASAVASYGGFPSNADVQSLARKDDSTFNFALNSDKTIVGTTPAAKGSVILDPFNRDRTGKVPAISIVTDNGRPETVAFFAGRLFMAGIRSDLSSTTIDNYVWNDTIFFSQTITSKINVGEFLQEADPTSENIADLIATDGGTISIPDIGSIIKLIVVRDILLVIADNGVWQISGDAGAPFTATVFNVSQVTTSGGIGRDSILKIEDKVIYWSDEGIFAIQGDSQSGLLSGQNIISSTIQTLYLGISNIGKQFAQGVYDKVARKVRYMYSTSSAADGLSWRFKADTELVFDLDLKAWSKTTVGELATSSPYIAGYVVTPFEVISQVEVPVVANGVPVVAATVPVVVLVNRVERREVTEVKYLTLVPNGATTNLTFSIQKDDNFVDWVSSDAVGVDAPAFAVTGHFHGGDLPKQKLITYMTVFLTKTEVLFESDGAGGIVPDNPSSCLMQVWWDYNTTTTGNKISRSVETYKHRRDPIPESVGDAHDTGQSVVITKHKVRGKGRGLSIRFDSTPGKDLHLLGWHLDMSVVS